MPTSPARPDDPTDGGDPAGQLTIGELARSTEVAVATLRAWESRHGFPPSTRASSGHRRYSADTVAAVEEVVRRQRAGTRLDRAIAETMSAREQGESAYAVLRQRHPYLPVLRLTKTTMLALSRAVEDECLASARRATMFGAFQTADRYELSRARWDALAETSDSTWVFADFALAHREEATGVVQVPLPSGVPLRREWVVICDAPDLPVAMSAWEPPGQDDTPDRLRIFECVWTLDPQAVRDASSVCAGVAEALGAPGAGELSRQLATTPVGVVDPGAATRLFSRLLHYVDGNVRRSQRT